MARIYSFQAKVASRGYHVFEETTWGHASVGDRVVVERNLTSINIDPYTCAIKNNETDLKIYSAGSGGYPVRVRVRAGLEIGLGLGLGLGLERGLGLGLGLEIGLCGYPTDIRDIRKWLG